MNYEIVVRSQNDKNSMPLVYEHREYRDMLKVNDRLSFPIGTHLTIRRSTPISLF